MNIDKDGKLDMWGKMDIKVLEEFDWNVEDMAAAIRELREELEKAQKDLEKAN